ncbi:hypothetical protein [Streptomyces fradiae]|uniref:hypothetical protein n=1 Tax=Streptomyces fradiae TaxID=1906 RepID=UPI003513AC1C
MAAATEAAEDAPTTDRDHRHRFLGIPGLTGSPPRTAVVVDVMRAFTVDGRAAEDLACAEYIARLLGDGDGDAGAGPDVAPYVRRARDSRAAGELAEGVRRGYRGVHAEDVALCLEADRFGFAMVARREGALTVLRPVEVCAPASRHSGRVGGQG